MAERIYVTTKDGNIEPLEETAFALEDELQMLIAEHPGSSMPRLPSGNDDTVVGQGEVSERRSAFRRQRLVRYRELLGGGLAVAPGP